MPSAANPPSRDEIVAEIAEGAAELDGLEPAQSDLWASGAAALWADGDPLDDGTIESLVRATANLPEALAERGEGAAAVAVQHLLTGDRFRLLRAVGVSDRHGLQSVVLDFGTADGAAPDHALLIDVDCTGNATSGPAVDARFSGPDPLSALDPEPGQEGDRRTEDLLLEDLATQRLHELLTVAFAEPVPATESLRLNQLAVHRRLDSVVPGLAVDLVLANEPVYVPHPRDAEDDAMALRLLQAAVPSVLRADPPTGWRAALAGFGTDRIDADDACTAAGIVDVDSVEALARVSVAYVCPVRLDGFAVDDARAIDALEWADWLGAVVQLVRSGPGTAVSGESLVDNVNASPEITTTIPKRDRAYIAYAFEQTLHAWEAAGALGADAELTELGAWLLPVGLAILAGDEDLAARCREFVL